MRIRMSHKEIHDANSLRVEFGTNCPRGGDGGHGGVTVFRLQDIGGTDSIVRLGGQAVGTLTDGLEVVLRGDRECVTFMKALRYAISACGKEQEIVRC